MFCDLKVKNMSKIAFLPLFLKISTNISEIQQDLGADKAQMGVNVNRKKKN